MVCAVQGSALSCAEVKVMIRYGQIILSIVLLVVLAYLGLTWCAHKIHFCMTAGQEECHGPFYHARHIFAAFIMTCVLGFTMMWPVGMLMDRWKKDVEREEARIHEKKKQQAVEEFRGKE